MDFVIVHYGLFHHLIWILMASNMELSPRATQQFVELLGTVVVGKGMVD